MGSGLEESEADEVDGRRQQRGGGYRQDKEIRSLKRGEKQSRQSKRASDRKGSRTQVNRAGAVSRKGSRTVSSLHDEVSAAHDEDDQQRDDGEGQGDIGLLHSYLTADAGQGDVHCGILGYECHNLSL